MNCPGFGEAYALTPDGEELWLTTQTSNDVAVIRTEDRRLLRRIPVGHSPKRLIVGTVGTGVPRP